jgi:M6 family metalloprotease-like protein
LASQQVRVRIQLTNAKGGAGALITRVSSSGLAASGWTTATPVPGSQSTSNNQNTLRDHQDLADDVFTAAMNHIRTSGWNADAVRAQFEDFDVMVIGFVGACPIAVPVADQWNSADPVDFSRLRMFKREHQATDRNNPNPGDPPVTMGTDVVIGQPFNTFDPGTMSHEIGHGLGLPDLYEATGFRDDVLYLDEWCQMAGDNFQFNHFCAWSKWSVGWIVESSDALLNRVIDVPMPAPAGMTTTEAWLVPVEHWDNAMRADVVAEVGSGLPIGQMMKVHLGSDGGVVDLIEFRSLGVAYSQQLPPTPAVIVTNVLQPGTDRRWAVNGLYRREAHLLNDGNELLAVGDTWDFAAGHEFPLTGCRVEIVELRSIRGGTIPICRLKVERDAAEFIDLYFEDNVPSWRSPDIWVDWPGDNTNPAVPRIYPEGTPTDQGEVVRFPSSGVEPHFLVVRPHNAGHVRAEDVKLRWFICDPPGAGDDGRWLERDTLTLPQVAAGTSDIGPFTWNVDPATNAHQCLRAEIIDWTIPAEVDPATGDTLALSSDDVLRQNNNAQKNVFDFEATT